MLIEELQRQFEQYENRSNTIKKWLTIFFCMPEDNEKKLHRLLSEFIYTRDKKKPVFIKQFWEFCAQKNAAELLSEVLASQSNLAGYLSVWQESDDQYWLEKKNNSGIFASIPDAPLFGLLEFCGAKALARISNTCQFFNKVIKQNKLIEKKFSPRSGYLKVLKADGVDYDGKESIVSVNKNADSDIIAVSRDGDIFVFDANTIKPVDKISVHRNVKREIFGQAYLLTTGNLIIRNEKNLIVWDSLSGKKIKTIDTQFDFHKALVDAECYVVANHEQAIFYDHNINFLRKISLQLQLPKTSQVSALAYKKDVGLAIATNAAKIYLLNENSGNKLDELDLFAALKINKAVVTAIKIVSKSQIVFHIEGQGLFVWDLQANQRNQPHASEISEAYVREENCYSLQLCAKDKVNTLMLLSDGNVLCVTDKQLKVIHFSPLTQEIDVAMKNMGAAFKLKF